MQAQPLSSAGFPPAPVSGRLISRNRRNNTTCSTSHRISLLWLSPTFFHTINVHCKASPRARCRRGRPRQRNLPQESKAENQRINDRHNLSEGSVRLPICKAQSKHIHEEEALLWPWVDRDWPGKVRPTPRRLAIVANTILPYYHREHLYRCHSLPRYSCPRCFWTSESQVELNRHSRANPPCKTIEQNPNPDDGLNEDQKSKIRSRKYHATGCGPVSEADRWKQIYRICFPTVEEDEVPSPCKFHRIHSELSHQI